MKKLTLLVLPGLFAGFLTSCEPSGQQNATADGGENEGGEGTQQVESKTKAHEKVVDDLVALVGEMSDKLGEAKDAESVEQATDFIKSMPQKMEPIVVEAEELGELSEEEARKVGKLAEEKMKTVQDEMNKNLSELDDESAREIKNAMAEVGQKMQKLIDRIEARYPYQDEQEEGAAEDKAADEGTSGS